VDQEGIATYGSDPSHGFMHTGEKIFPYGEHVFGIRVEVGFERFGSIIIPESAKENITHFGKMKGVRPWQLMQCLAVGPDIKETNISPGSYYIVDPWNTEQQKVGNVWYFFPREGAIVARTQYEGD